MDCFWLWKGLRWINGTNNWFSHLCTCISICYTRYRSMLIETGSPSSRKCQRRNLTGCSKHLWESRCKSHSYHRLITMRTGHSWNEFSKEKTAIQAHCWDHVVEIWHDYPYTWTYFILKARTVLRLSSRISSGSGKGLLRKPWMPEK